jgi:hypothetical protein
MGNTVRVVGLTPENYVELGFSCFLNPKRLGHWKKLEWLKERLPEGFKGQMKHKSLRNRARLIDHLIDAYRESMGTQFIPEDKLTDVVSTIYPNFEAEGSGRHKTVFRLNQGNHHDFALKIGPKDDIENDHKMYKRLPTKLRHEFLAKMFWHTKYCLLQEYGTECEISVEELNKLRELGYKYGLIDIKPLNIRKIGDHLKIIDANAVRYRFSGFWRIIEHVKWSLSPSRKNLQKKKGT